VKTPVLLGYCDKIRISFDEEIQLPKKCFMVEQIVNQGKQFFSLFLKDFRSYYVFLWSIQLLKQIKPNDENQTDQ
jgi:hypothetical protein